MLFIMTFFYFEALEVIIVVQLLVLHGCVLRIWWCFVFSVFTLGIILAWREGGDFCSRARS